MFTGTLNTYPYQKKGWNIMEAIGTVANFTKKLTFDGKEFTVDYKTSTVLKRLEKSVTSGTNFYNASDAWELFLSARKNEYGRLNYDLIPTIESDRLESLFADFAIACAAIATDSAIDRVVAEAPKKKNGQLALKRVQKLFNFPAANASGEYYEVVAVNVGDAQITIEARKGKGDPEILSWKFTQEEIDTAQKLHK
jgi:hypothetical protein